MERESSWIVSDDGQVLNRWTGETREAFVARHESGARTLESLGLGQSQVAGAMRRVVAMHQPTLGGVRLS
jgi:hypothetical protein